jgi:hypothetical protein
VTEFESAKAHALAADRALATYLAELALALAEERSL